MGRTVAFFTSRRNKEQKLQCVRSRVRSRSRSRSRSHWNSRLRFLSNKISFPKRFKEHIVGPHRAKTLRQISLAFVLPNCKGSRICVGQWVEQSSTNSSKVDSKSFSICANYGTEHKFVENSKLVCSFVTVVTNRTSL